LTNSPSLFLAPRSCRLARILFLQFSTPSILSRISPPFSFWPFQIAQFTLSPYCSGVRSAAPLLPFCIAPSFGPERPLTRAVPIESVGLASTVFSVVPSLQESRVPASPFLALFPASYRLRMLEFVQLCTGVPAGAEEVLPEVFLVFFLPPPHCCPTGPLFS